MAAGECSKAISAASSLDVYKRQILSEDFAPYKLGIEGRQIYMAYRIHLSDLTEESEDEIRTNLVNLAFKADDMDNMLVEQFGCEFSEYSKQEA